MRAAWYDRQGPAREVLQVGQLPDPWPGEGEVRVRVSVSGIHVGDLGKRQGWWGDPPWHSPGSSRTARVRE